MKQGNSKWAVTLITIVMFGLCVFIMWRANVLMEKEIQMLQETLEMTEAGELPSTEQIESTKTATKTEMLFLVLFGIVCFFSFTFSSICCS